MSRYDFYEKEILFNAPCFIGEESRGVVYHPGLFAPRAPQAQLAYRLRAQEQCWVLISHNRQSHQRYYQ